MCVPVWIVADRFELIPLTLEASKKVESEDKIYIWKNEKKKKKRIQQGQEGKTDELADYEPPHLNLHCLQIKLLALECHL